MRRRIRGMEGSGDAGHDGGGSLRWLLTYADMITLLMAFFIMLYSMSVLNLAKFKQVAISIRSGFAGLLEGQGKFTLSATGQLSLRPSAVEGDTAGVPFSMIRRIKDFIKEKDLSENMDMYSDRRGLVIKVNSDNLLFAVGSASLRPESLPILYKVAEIINNVPNNVAVEGHTCDLPVRSGQYASNWELSTARATNVVRFLIDKGGVPVEKLSASGYAHTRPLVPNVDSKSRRQNRRVEFVLMRQEQSPPEAAGAYLPNPPSNPAN